MSEEKDEKEIEALVEKQADLNVSQIAHAKRSHQQIITSHFRLLGRKRLVMIYTGPDANF